MTQHHFDVMHNWLFFHMVYVIISVVLAGVVWYTYKNINMKVTKRSAKEEEAIQRDRDEQQTAKVDGSDNYQK